ncbi:MAG: branched-chain amino acid ABC transporter permease [Armatimonadota bacterium]|nr:branched-chain amino acid ABC transporter permease [Armatimonadota bacterium]MDR7449132.1 branched-chain amino acid ABC transporter permease [Armatimonadota bacterium]MDR7460033.1 branched-chain amino acid ABC transporter permease [Armatimonadota bacterium]MDR7480848.1 branched-chain amino acid ABC transporter permease [Armatimonadota bacterium]MDR7489301.1 branched-chain amino acid ABC transporter permease [Armatimonadota bacterium]
MRAAALLRAGGVAAAAALLLLLAERTLNEYHLRLLNVVGINVILATSLNLTNGFTGIFSLGHAGFMAVGAYAGTLLTFPVARKAMLQPDLPRWLAQVEWPFLPALLAGGALAALAAVAVGWPVLRLRGHYLAVATLGFMVIVQVLATNLDRYTRGALGINGIPPYTTLWWVAACMAATLVVLRHLLGSGVGRALRAVRDDDLVAQALGIPVARYRLGALTLGAFFAGVAGVLWAHLITVISPGAFSFLLTFQIVVMVVVGGMGSLSGSVVAAVLLTLVPEGLRRLEQGAVVAGLTIPPLFGLSQIVLACALVLVMIYRPEGLLGQAEVGWRPLRHLRDLRQRRLPAREAEERG